jgi:anti-sigma regulatory factor (Ser/Thr protein kinase)
MDQGMMRADNIESLLEKSGFSKYLSKITDAFLDAPGFSYEHMMQSLLIIDAASGTHGANKVRVWLEKNCAVGDEVKKAAFIGSVLELAENARKHAYNYTKGNKVYLQLTTSPNISYCSVLSFGRAATEEALGNTLRTYDVLQKRRSGMGLFFARAASDVFLPYLTPESTEISVGIIH